jgi:UDP-3-O-[3-hydroxymyristoyl] glucosamine N-acyltransferase
MSDPGDEIPREVRLQDLAETLDLGWVGDGQFPIRGVASLETAGPNDLVHVRDASHMDPFIRSHAGAVILPEGLDRSAKHAIYSRNPLLDFARAVECICPTAVPPPGIDPGAFVAPDADVSATAWIGAGASIGARSRVGAGSAVHPNATLYPDVTIGEDCTIHSGAVVREGSLLGDRVILQPGAVIGGDGFGHVPDETGALHKVPQIGRVVIGNDVEIGANTTIDRASLTQTAIADRVKLDNLIQIAHGCEVGSDVVIAAQSGLSGSTRIGRGTIVMAQVGVAGHLEIGSRAFLGARAGLHKNVGDGARVYGIPQMEERGWHRSMAALKRLPELLKRLRAVERKLGLRGDPSSSRVDLPGDPPRDTR